MDVHNAFNHTRRGPGGVEYVRLAAAQWHNPTQRHFVQEKPKGALLYFRESRQGSGVAPSDENPRGFRGRHMISARHREFHVVCEVLQIVDRLLDSMVLEAFDGEVIIWV